MRGARHYLSTIATQALQTSGCCASKPHPSERRHSPNSKHKQLLRVGANTMPRRSVFALDDVVGEAVQRRRAVAKLGECLLGLVH